MSKATKTVAASRVRAVRLTNAACPRCDQPVYFHPDRWLFCRWCTGAARVRVTTTDKTPVTITTTER